MVCWAGWGWGRHDVEWIILVCGRVRKREEQGGDWGGGGGGRRRLGQRAGDACAMNQLSKYGPCSSSQHTHPLPVQSGWKSLVHLLFLLAHIYYSTLLTVMEEAPQVNRSHILTAQYVFFSANSLYYRWHPLTHVQEQQACRQSSCSLSLNPKSPENVGIVCICMDTFVCFIYIISMFQKWHSMSWLVSGRWRGWCMGWTVDGATPWQHSFYTADHCLRPTNNNTGCSLTTGSHFPVAFAELNIHVL